MSREKERIPDFDHTYCVQGLNITTSQNSITENGNRLNSLYWYKAIVRFTHLVTRILQHGCKFRSWVKETKYQINQFTISHLQTWIRAAGYKNLPACKTAKILTAFLILRNNFPFKYRHRKKIKAWKTECEDRQVAG